MDLADRLRSRVLLVATSNQYGEQGGNNQGKFIEAMGGTPGNEWCAIYAGYCYRRAYTLLGMPQPRWLFRRLGVPEPGAKRLAKNMVALGGGVRFMDPALVLPGDLAVWSRGFLGWQGHIGIVTKQDDGIVTCLEGNVGKYPAKVRPLTHDVTKERFYGFFGFR